MASISAVRVPEVLVADATPAPPSPPPRPNGVTRVARNGRPLALPPAGGKQLPEVRPVRVCFMIDQLSAAGTESQLVALIRHLDRSRVEPFLCLLDGHDEPSRTLAPDCCPVLRLGIRSFRHPATAYRALRLARFLRRHRIDVLQVYFPRSTYLGVPVARLAGVPYVVRTRNNLGYWMTPAHRWFGRLYNRFVDRTLANCAACRESVLRDEGPAPESVVVLENGVDVKHFLDIPDLRPDEAPRTVGVVANLRPVKELHLLVEAASRLRPDHPDASFLIAGEGELRPALERQVLELGLQDRVHLVGSVGDVPAFLAGLHIAVLCSRSEGMSNAVLEYMAAGRAVVATAVGATTQLIDDGVHGLLVPPGDGARLAGAIGRLLRNPGLAARLGAAARQRALERYSREAMVGRFEAFFQGLVRRREDAHG